MKKKPSEKQVREKKERPFTITRTKKRGKETITEQIPVSNKLKLFNIKEACIILNMIERNVRRAIYNGELVASKIGNKIMITEDNLEKYIKACESKVLTHDTELKVVKKKF